MADRLRVRLYNVRFGDGILVSIPDREGSKTKMRHILIDVGNFLNREGGVDEVFKPVFENILQELNGQELDLYVMTHEHLDHIQGLCYADKNVFRPGELKTTLNVQYVWITSSADPNYLKTHPKARRRELYDECENKLRSMLKALESEEAKKFEAILINNNPRSTEDCVEYIRNLVDGERRFYIYRGVNLSHKHPFKEAIFDIWAPEEDTSGYYPKGMLPLALHQGAEKNININESNASPEPPSGVDTGAFYDLLSMRESGLWDNLLAIDKAENNSSLAFSITWRGHILLFAGDAEKKSWRMMEKQNIIRKVDFYKVSHHGSQTGMPDEAILDRILPKPVQGKMAAISTWENTYSGIPHPPTNMELKKRAKLWSTVDDKNNLFKDFYFSG